MTSLIGSDGSNDDFSHWTPHAASSLQAKVLFGGLIQNGRLTFEQLVERSISKGQHMDQAMRENHWSKLRACFNKLVRWHYVERCPRPEPFIYPDSEDQTKPTKRRRTKNLRGFLKSQRVQ